LQNIDNQLAFSMAYTAAHSCTFSSRDSKKTIESSSLTYYNETSPYYSVSFAAAIVKK